MKKIIFSYSIITCLFFFSFTNISAQEVQVAMDKEGKVFQIDSKLEKKLHIFKTYKGFKNALLFEVSESSYVLEISYQPEKLLLKERKPLNNEELIAFRKNVSENIKQKAPESIVNQEGLSHFLINNAAISLTYYGFAIPVIAEPQEPKTALGLFMLTAGSGFFIPYALTKGKQVTKADATLSFYGQTRGAMHGAVLPLLFANDANPRGILASSVGVSIAEGTAGFLWADKTNMSHGKATALGVFSDFGMGIGLATTHILGLYETGSDEISSRALASGILGGSILGISSGLFLNKHTNYTRGDAFALRTSGLLGASIPATILFAADISGDNSGKYYSLSASLGAISGLAFGHVLAKKNDFTTNQGVLIQLGTLAGGAMGLGLTYLVTDEDHAIVSAGTIGALLGYGLLTSSFAKRKSLKKDNRVSFNFSLNPNAILSFSKQANTTKAPPTFFNANLTF